MPLLTQRDGQRAPWLPGERVKRRDGTCIEARERRLTVLREVQGGAVPGQSLVVSEPAHGLGRDGFPCEDGHAQERSMLGRVRETGPAHALWSQERNCCPCAFLCASDSRGAWCITRQHAGRPVAVVKTLRAVGRIETGHVAAQRVQGQDAQGGMPLCRRLRGKLAQATRDGERGLYMLTNVPLRKASATRVARVYRQRWTRATACQHREASFHSALTPLGSPKAAWFGLCLALVAYKMLAVVLGALRSVHGETMDHDRSLS